MKVVSTENWTFDQLAPYTADITAAMKKLADKYPDDMTVESLAMECLSGQQQLWLILDEDDKFISFCLTQIRKVEATGKKMVTLTNMAGEAGLACADAMCDVIESWAQQQGADITAAIGSRAWVRKLKDRGYREYATIFRRDVQ